MLDFKFGVSHFGFLVSRFGVSGLGMGLGFKGGIMFGFIGKLERGALHSLH